MGDQQRDERRSLAQTPGQVLDTMIALARDLLPDELGPREQLPLILLLHDGVTGSHALLESLGDGRSREQQLVLEIAYAVVSARACAAVLIGPGELGAPQALTGQGEITNEVIGLVGLSADGARVLAAAPVARGPEVARIGEWTVSATEEQTGFQSGSVGRGMQIGYSFLDAEDDSATPGRFLQLVKEAALAVAIIERRG